jgi:hypothetical protein
MKNLKFIVLIVLSALSIHSFSQIGVTSYSIYALGINTSQLKRKVLAEDGINLRSLWGIRYSLGTNHD